MINSKTIKDLSGKIELCETFTTDETKVLKQVETGVIYGSNAIDIIKGYKNGKPYSRFTYVEVDKPEEGEQL